MNFVEQHLAPFSGHSAFWAEAIKVLRMCLFPLWLMDENLGFVLVFSLLSSHKFGWTHLNSEMEDNLWLLLTFVRYLLCFYYAKLWCNLRIHFLVKKSIHIDFWELVQSTIFPISLIIQGCPDRVMPSITTKPWILKTALFHRFSPKFIKV